MDFSSFRKLHRFFVFPFFFVLTACQITQYKDVEIVDSNITTFHLQAEKRMNDLWTFSGTYLPIKGEQKEGFELTTTTYVSGDNTRFYQDIFAAEDFRIESPKGRAGTTPVSLKYKHNVFDLVAERRFQSAAPFRLRQAFGVRYTANDFEFTTPAESLRASGLLDQFMPMYGLNFEYTLTKNLGFELAGNVSMLIPFIDTESWDYSGALTYRIGDHLELTARFFTFHFQDSSEHSEVAITSNGRALGIKVKL